MDRRDGLSSVGVNIAYESQHDKYIGCWINKNETIIFVWRFYSILETTIHVFCFYCLFASLLTISMKILLSLFASSKRLSSKLRRLSSSSIFLVKYSTWSNFAFFVFGSSEIKNYHIKVLQWKMLTEHITHESLQTSAILCILGY